MKYEPQMWFIYWMKCILVRSFQRHASRNEFAICSSTSLGHQFLAGQIYYNAIQFFARSRSVFIKHSAAFNWTILWASVFSLHRIIRSISTQEWKRESTVSVQSVCCFLSCYGELFFIAIPYDSNAWFKWTAIALCTQWYSIPT